jgi:glycosyltransferase involved in cell wall biosynthesis
VSTRFGAMGYDLEDGKELMLADTPDDFASACITLINQPDTGNSLADRAFEKFLRRWTWDAIAPTVWKAAEDCLRRG